MSSQSPIQLDLETALILSQPQKLFELKYAGDTEVWGCFEGHGGEANFIVKKGSAIIVFRGDEYELKKIHLHSGSEHAIGHDDHQDMELHFVHAPKGSLVSSPLVAIGVLFTKSTTAAKDSLANRAAAKLIESAMSEECATINPLSLMPRSDDGTLNATDWFHYEGSLTSYPYSENVSWIVMKETASLSSHVIAQLASNATQPVRGLQPLERRLVVRSF